jgi:CHAD domain-containing protein
VAPLATTVAASVVVGVGLILARTERERRYARRKQLDRRLALAPDERLPTGLRRMALGQVDLVLEFLGAGQGLTLDAQAVHETRKALKRLRALLRLLEDELGARAFARENAVLRETAQSLSGARDAEVMLSTIEELIERHPRTLGRRDGVLKLRTRLLAERARAERLTLSDPATRAEVLGELRTFRCRVAAWSLPDRDGIQLIESDLMRLYRQGRSRYRNVLRRQGEEMAAMHEWRKRVKDLRYAAEMLERRAPGKPAAPGARGRHQGGKQARASEHAKRLHRLARRADALGELLGEEHDLAVFAQHLREGERAGGPERWRTGRRTRKKLLKLIARRRRELRRRALREGERLYRPAPKRFMRRIGAAYLSGARRLS